LTSTFAKMPFKSLVRNPAVNQIQDLDLASAKRKLNERLEMGITSWPRKNTLASSRGRCDSRQSLVGYLLHAINLAIRPVVTYSRRDAVAYGLGFVRSI
jgi:hypothetical protein